MLYNLILFKDKLSFLASCYSFRPVFPAQAEHICTLICFCLFFSLKGDNYISKYLRFRGVVKYHSVFRKEDPTHCSWSESQFIDHTNVSLRTFSFKILLMKDWKDQNVGMINKL